MPVVDVGFDLAVVWEVDGVRHVWMDMCDVGVIPLFSGPTCCNVFVNIVTASRSWGSGGGRWWSRSCGSGGSRWRSRSWGSGGGGRWWSWILSGCWWIRVFWVVRAVFVTAH